MQDVQDGLIHLPQLVADSMERMWHSQKGNQAGRRERVLAGANVIAARDHSGVYERVLSGT